MKHNFTVRTAARRAAFLLPLLLLLLSAGSHAAPPTIGPAPVAIERYADPATARQQIFQTGYQNRVALRGWMETVPSSVFAPGINWTNVPLKQIDATMRHLQRNGFRHIRLEIGWVALDAQGNITDPVLIETLKAAKKYNIRPLILLNTHEGVPTPVETTRVTLLEPMRSGDRSFLISHEDAEKVHLFRSGFSHKKTFPEQVNAPYMAANVLAIAKWDFGGGPGTNTRVHLSRPLYEDIPAGPVELQTLLAAPLFAARPVSDPASTVLMPIQLDSLHRWIGLYVKPLSERLRLLLGDGGWDYEVANELMFGAAWFSATDQYIDEEAKRALGWVFNRPLLDEVVRRTVDYVHQHHKGVLTVNGTTSQNIWTTAKTETTTEMHSRHFYVPRIVRDGITYWYPEQTASQDYDGINSMYLDLLPWDQGQFGRNNHSWNRDGTPGPASTLAETEGGSVAEYATHTPGVTLSIADCLHLRAKFEIRKLLFFANKGGVNRDGRGTRYYLYTLREGSQSEEAERHTLGYHQVAAPAFFRYLEQSGGIYPPPEKEAVLTARTFTAIKRARSYLPIRPRLTLARSITVERIEESHGNVQIEGGPQGTLYNRDLLAVLPFQTSDNSFAIPIYVQTLNLGKEYRGGSDPARFDMPAERYRIKLVGLRWVSGTSTARLVDVMSGTSKAVSVGADGYIELDITDAPRILVLKGV